MTDRYHVTLYRLQLDAQDSVTGWFNTSWKTKTIKMPIQQRGSRTLNFPVGVYVKTDALGLTQDVVHEGDRIKTRGGQFYEVKAVKPHWDGKSFLYRECDLTLLPFATLSYSTSTPDVSDARSNTKSYWGKYLGSWSTYLSSDCPLNGHSWIVCFSDASYPITRVFRDKYYEVVYTVGEPESTPLVQGDQTIYGYEEAVPTDIWSLDTELQWLSESALRKIVEAKPDGSRRTLARRSSRVENLGSTQLYHTTFVLNYKSLKDRTL